MKHIRWTSYKKWLKDWVSLSIWQKVQTAKLSSSIKSTFYGSVWLLTHLAKKRGTNSSYFVLRCLHRYFSINTKFKNKHKKTKRESSCLTKTHWKWSSSKSCCDLTLAVKRRAAITSAKTCSYVSNGSLFTWISSTARLCYLHILLQTSALALGMHLLFSLKSLTTSWLASKLCGKSSFLFLIQKYKRELLLCW